MSEQKTTKPRPTPTDTPAPQRPISTIARRDVRTAVAKTRGW